jgi:hypothetical protein
MVLIEWIYSCTQPSPYIELSCTAAELAEAKEKLSKEEFGYWVQAVHNDTPHAEAMEVAVEEAVGW